MGADGANVGANTSSLAAPGQTKVYTYIADHEGVFITTLEVDQGGAINLLIQRGRRTLEKTIRYVIKLFEVQRNHNMPAKIQAKMTGR